VPHYYWQRG